jgi:hypothetical protein
MAEAQKKRWAKLKKAETECLLHRTGVVLHEFVDESVAGSDLDLTARKRHGPLVRKTHYATRRCDPRRTSAPGTCSWRMAAALMASASGLLS